MHAVDNPNIDSANRIQLMIPSRLDAVPLLGSMVKAICESVGLGDTDRQLVGLCLVEAANNAIIHAYCEKEGGTVGVEVTLYPEKLIFDVVDFGRAGDPEKMNSDHRAALSESSPQFSQAESGRGLAIMQEVMDSVEYTVRSNNNRLRLVKYVERQQT